MEINVMFWASSHKYSLGKRKCDYSDKKKKFKFSLSDLQTHQEGKRDVSACLETKRTKRKLKNQKQQYTALLTVHSEKPNKS